jgi:hypothetical protein
MRLRPVQSPLMRLDGRWWHRDDDVAVPPAAPLPQSSPALELGREAGAIEDAADPARPTAGEQ